MFLNELGMITPLGGILFVLAIGSIVVIGGWLCQ